MTDPPMISWVLFFAAGLALVFSFSVMRTNWLTKREALEILDILRKGRG